MGATNAAVLTERLRIGLVVVLFATAVFALIELAIDRSDVSILAVLAVPKLIQIGSVCAAMLLVPRLKGSVVPLALAVVAVLAATISASNVLRRDTVTTQHLMVLIVVSTGVLFPWGAWAQLATVSIATAALIANAALVRGGLHAVLAYPSATIAFVFAASIYINHLVERHQLATAQHSEKRRQAETALREKAELLHTVVTGAPIVLFALDRDGVFTLSEGTGLALLGLEPGQMVGRSVFESYGHLMLGAFERALAGEAITAQRQIGDVAFEVACSPLRDESGAVNGVVGVCTDITERRRAEEALRRSEAHFRSLSENALDVVSVLRPDGGFAYASPSHERVVGYTPAELEGRGALDLVHPEDHQRVAAALGEVVQNPGRAVAVEARYRNKNGSWVDVESIGTALGADLGGGVVVNSRDVTERKRAELKTRVLLEVARTVSGTLDVAAMIDRVQRATAEMLPCDSAAVFRFDTESRTSRMVSHHGLSADLAAKAERLVFRSGELFGGRFEAGETMAFDLRGEQPAVLRRVCERLPLQAVVVAPLRVRDRHLGALVAANVERTQAFTAGQVELCSGIAQQLAVSIEAAELYQKQLEEAEVSNALAHMSREVISTLSTPALLERLCQLTAEILGCDCSHTFLLDGTEEFLVPIAGHGDTPEQWEALRVLEVPHPMIARLLERLEREQAVQVVMDEPQDLVPPALPQRYGITFSAYIALLRGEEVIGLLTAAFRGRRERFDARRMRIARGISQLASIALANARLVEDLERANRLKSEFVATMSHELRTPIHVVLGYTNLIREREFGPLTDEQDNVLERVENGATQLLELVNATLDLSRLEPGRVPLSRQEVDIASLLGEVDRDTRDLQRKPGLSTGWDVAPALPLITTDPAKLKVVLKNLLGNALKFTDSGSVRVCARPADNGVEICVHDTGIGISKEVAPFIFDAFRQGDGSSTRRHGGVGLGLYIVRRLLDALGGTVSVESEPGHGSTFRIRLPSEVAEEPCDLTGGEHRKPTVPALAVARRGTAAS